MKLIIFRPLLSISTEQGYAASIRTAYLLNAEVVSAGVAEQEYRLMEDKRNVPIEVKLKYQLKCYSPGATRDQIVDASKLIREFNASRNKYSKQIVIMAKIKKFQERLFDDYIRFRFKTLDDSLFIGAMLPLIHPQKFHFYQLPCDLVLIENKANVSKVKLLQQLLPDLQGSNAMFFIDRHKAGGLLDIKICYSQTEMAEDPEMIYGQPCFVFPKMDLMTSNEIAQARVQLEEPSREFREKIEQWAAICYQSPTTNAGLVFFRENLKDFLATMARKVLQTPILKNVSDLTREKSQTEIIICQAPIEKIWCIYREINAISEVEYNELLQIKKEQFPKYEGKWPVVFQTFLLDDLNNISTEIEVMSSSRKSISID